MKHEHNWGIKYDDPSGRLEQARAYRPQTPEVGMVVEKSVIQLNWTEHIRRGVVIARGLGVKRDLYLVRFKGYVECFRAGE